MARTSRYSGNPQIIISSDFTYVLYDVAHISPNYEALCSGLFRPFTKRKE